MGSNEVFVNDGVGWWKWRKWNVGEVDMGIGGVAVWRSGNEMDDCYACNGERGR